MDTFAISAAGLADSTVNLTSICCILSALIFALLLVYNATYVFRKYKKRRFFTITNINIGGAFLSIYLILFPLFLCGVKSPCKDTLSAAITTAVHSIKFFAIGEDYNAIISLIDSQWTLHSWYSVLVTLFYLYAPLITLSFILTIIKKISSRFRYFINGWKETHVFSELNERSLALAKDIYKTKGGNSRIVFANIINKNEEKDSALIEEALSTGAILFHNDLTAINYRWRWTHSFWRRNISFYLISDNEDEKLAHYNYINEKYDWDNIFLYVFSDDICCQMLLSSKAQRKIKVVRINDIQALIYNNLYNHGARLFQRAALCNDYKISAVIVGLGKYGTEMLKALLWFCQFPGFDLKITAFDSDENAEDRFKSLCPDILEHNNKRANGDAEYSLKIHSGADVYSSNFIEKIQEVNDASFVFICLGEDKKNLSISKRIREAYEEIGISPDIETIIYNSKTSKEISCRWDENIRELIAYEQGDNEAYDPGGVRNHRNQTYRIHATGDLESFYSIRSLPISDKSDKKEKSFAALVNLGESADNTWNSYKQKVGLLECDALALLSAMDTPVEQCEESLFIVNSGKQKSSLMRGSLEEAIKIIKKNSSSKESEEKMTKLLTEQKKKLVFISSENEKDILFFIESVEDGINAILKDFVLSHEEIKPAPISKKIEELSFLIKKVQPFWRFEYNFCSSISKALHKELCSQLLALNDSDPLLFNCISNQHQGNHISIDLDGATTDHEINTVFDRVKRDHIPEIVRYAIEFPLFEEEESKANTNPRNYDKKTLSRADLLCFGELENRRWCAYMRTEGYSGEKVSPTTRNDLGKIHGNIRPYYEIDNKTLKYDV